MYATKNDLPAPRRQQMIALHELFGKLMRSAIETSDRAGDEDTNDIFIEISQGVDKWVWMVEAHLQPEGGRE
jgi:starvation-inducible DNA-binding protein